MKGRRVRGEVPVEATRRGVSPKSDGVGGKTRGPRRQGKKMGKDLGRRREQSGLGQ